MDGTFTQLIFQKKQISISNKDEVNINLLTQYDNNKYKFSKILMFLDNISLEDNLSLDSELNNQQNQLDKNEEGFSEEETFK